MLRARGTAPAAGDAATDKAKEARRAELDQAVGALLRELQIRHLRGTLSLHDPVLALARTHVAQAVTMGAGARYQAALDTLLGAIAAEQSPASRMPHLDGAALPAMPKAYESFDWRTSKEARAWGQRMAERGLGDRRRGQDNRRFMRYVAPALWVSVDGMHYRTLDWSIGGLALVGRRLDLVEGSEVRVTLAANIKDTQPPIFEDRAVVLRADWEAARLYLQFRSTASATLKILEYLRRKKIEPIEAAPRRDGEDG